MKQLRIIRIFAATLFTIASLAFVAIGTHVHPMAVISYKVQIILSQLSVCIGVTLIWLAVTVFAGRLYCATVCPVGNLLDVFYFLGSRFIKRRRRRFTPGSPIGRQLLVVYLVALVGGLSTIAWLIEPWNIMRNIGYLTNRDATAMTWGTLGLGVGLGILIGAASLIGLIGAGLIWGRRICAEVCPLGAALGIFSRNSVWHIEIDPDKCIHCGKCEEACPSQCIKQLECRVDNIRCVRCFECLPVCPNDAIRYQGRNNRRANPLLMKS